MEAEKSKRLGSLDILRGFDLFLLVFFQPVFSAFARGADIAWVNAVNTQFEHVHWEGFALWDLIMPLFMFMAGASMPFAFGKYLKNGSRTLLYRRILKRVFLLFILGMIAQGNLLALDSDNIYFYSNTLQAIAIGYLISAIILIHFKLAWQIVVTSGLLLIYWALLTFVSAGGFGGGDFSPDNNLAEYVDRLVLGRFRDGSQVTPAGIDFGNYRYTWIISSLNFGVTVMTGVFAGHILKSRLGEIKKIQWLLFGGIAMILAGQLWALQMPIIKKIWTSSMTLYSSGICFVLMALFYYLIDFRNYGKYMNWLKIYGMNSIMAYMLFMVFAFGFIAHSLLHGTEQIFGSFYPALISLGNVLIIFFILRVMHKRGYFLKV
jgi:predicted acyltransferase